MVYSVHEQIKRKAGCNQVAAQEAQDSAKARTVLGWSQEEVAQGLPNPEVEDLWWPDEPHIKGHNRQGLIEYGQHDVADDPILFPEKLDGALGRAQNAYYYGGNDFFVGASTLLHGIGEAQAYGDANKRASLGTVKDFFHNNGYDHLSPEGFDDEELANHLKGYGVWNRYQDYLAGRITEPPPYPDSEGNPVWPYSVEEEGPAGPSTIDVLKARHETWLKANGYE